MDLLEYQVKEWFNKIGIPVLPSQRIDHPTDLKKLKIPYPIVLKSQVYANDRSQVGGVKIVETTIDAIAAAQSIFSLPIGGELPKVLLAESKYNAQEEFYLAVVLDTVISRPVLLGCRYIDWQSPGENMQYVVVEQEFSPFYARRLAYLMGLRGGLMQSVSDIMTKMYHLFLHKDLDLVEINPLGVSSSCQVMTLNGKIRVNERAINRHPDIADIASKIARDPGSKRINGMLVDMLGRNNQGEIGILANGTGSALTTWDAVVAAGGKPAVSLNLRHSWLNHTEPTKFSQRMETGLRVLAADRNIQVILINLLGTIPELSEVPRVMTDFMALQLEELRWFLNTSQKTLPQRLPKIVMRLAGNDFQVARKSLLSILQVQSENFILVENLDVAVKEAVSLTKSQVYRK
ncbi:ATP-grasp domain-containing protein [Cylindrospermopsis raciborskii]|uniref:ATP-grasp domain-containing protein n=1 Tax=Cylindrospermopsis raciborskii TaxID=77022 RepID=UPI00387A7DAB